MVTQQWRIIAGQGEVCLVETTPRTSNSTSRINYAQWADLHTFHSFCCCKIHKGQRKLQSTKLPPTDHWRLHYISSTHRWLVSCFAAGLGCREFPPITNLDSWVPTTLITKVLSSPQLCLPISHPALLFFLYIVFCSGYFFSLPFCSKGIPATSWYWQFMDCHDVSCNPKGGPSSPWKKLQLVQLLGITALITVNLTHTSFSIWRGGNAQTVCTVLWFWKKCKSFTCNQLKKQIMKQPREQS